MVILGKLGNYTNFGLFIMRVGLGLMMIMHGYPKLAGGPVMWAGLGNSMTEMGVHFAPSFWGFMSAATEAVGGLFLVLGLWTRPVCLFLLIDMIVASFHHFHVGALQHSSTQDTLNQASHAIELAFVFFGLIFLGPGRFSIDKD